MVNRKLSLHAYFPLNLIIDTSYQLIIMLGQKNNYQIS